MQGQHIDVAGDVVIAMGRRICATNALRKWRNAPARLRYYRRIFRSLPVWFVIRRAWIGLRREHFRFDVSLRFVRLVH